MAIKGLSEVQHARAWQAIAEIRMRWIQGSIASGSVLIHDKEKAHKKLVQQLRLESIEYDSKHLNGLPDSENPLEPINRRCYEFQRLMRRHPGFSMEDFSGYLDLYSYIHNPPDDKYEKVEKLIKLIIENQNSLKYRD